MKKLVAIFAVLLSLGSPAWALEHFLRPIQDQNGNAVAGASVTVYISGTTTLATLYSDNGITSKPNPFTTSIDGLAEFYTANGLIDLKITKTGFPSLFWDANKTKRMGVFDPLQHVITYGSSFPQSPEIGAVFVITGDGGSCTGNSGELETLCRWNGTAWAVIGGAGGGGGSAQGLDANFLVDSSISTATTATPLRVGDGVSSLTDVCLGTDSTMGGFVKPCTDTDTRTPIWTNKTHCLYDVENASCMETFDPDAPSTLLMYQYAAPYRPLKQIWIDASMLTVDGANCTTPADRTINGVILTTMLCADNSSSAAVGKFPAPLNWDGGTLIFEQVIIQTAADTNPINADVSAQCRGNAETFSSSWGTAVAMDGAPTGSNGQNMITSAAVTPTGGCAAGDMIYFRYVVDSVGTTAGMGTLHTLGFTVRYREVSRSN